MSVELVTRSGGDGVYWRMPSQVANQFNPNLFDEQELQKNKLIDGKASAGRGNTWFLRWHDNDLVLRHYRRGGMVRHLSQSHYLYTGLTRTRAFAELDILSRLQDYQLPAPRPYACCVKKRGVVYQASLITYRMSGNTLSERMQQQVIEESEWHAIGRTIAQFHRVGIFHADLNAHNILVEAPDIIGLIDFDRAQQRDALSVSQPNSWGAKNLQRLNRSLFKLSHQAKGKLTASEIPAAMKMILQGYVTG